MRKEGVVGIRTVIRGLLNKYDVKLNLSRKYI